MEKLKCCVSTMLVNGTQTMPAMATALSQLIWDRLRILFYAVPNSEMLESLPSDWLAGGMEATQQTILAEDLISAKLPAYTLLAIPGFILLCAVELIVGLARGRNLYRTNDAIMSFMLGLVMILSNFITGAIGLATYCYIWSEYGFQNLVPITSTWHWVGLLCGIDMAYYFFHRTAHEYHLSWSAHSVHHSGEDYNLATALRQGAVQQFTSWPFKLPLALFFHPALYVMHSALNTLGQFWIHTQIIGSVGPLEYILNTPSHHRVHHRPPGNCNYAGVLIIWDRMFGTFKAEDKQTDYYGLAKQYKTFDPVWANFEHPRRVLEAARRKVDSSGGGSLALTLEFLRRCFRKRVHHPKVFQPGALFQNIREEHKESQPSSSLWSMPRGPPRRKRMESNALGGHFLIVSHVVYHFVLTLLLSIALLSKHKEMPSRAHALCASVYLLWTCSSLGRLFDGAMLGIYSETLRLCLVAIFSLTWDNLEEFTIIPKGMQTWFPSVAVLQLVLWIGVIVIAASQRTDVDEGLVQSAQKAEKDD